MAEETPQEPQRAVPLIRRAKEFRQIYVTGAIVHSSPLDFRLMLYRHEPDIPEEPTSVTSVPFIPIVQVELVMSLAVARQIRDLLNRQLPREQAAEG